MVTRERILTESARLFAKNGYKATNLQQVADNLGVTRQALYYYFRSKSDILAALFDEVMTRMEEGNENGQVDGAGEDFATLLESHIRVIVDNTDLVAVLLLERPEIAKLKDVPAARRRQEYSKRFLVAYEEGVAGGELRGLDPQLTVRMLLASANSISAWYHAGSREKPDKVAATATDLLLSGILLKPPTRKAAAKPKARSQRKAPAKRKTAKRASSQAKS
jgi:AcrR family transcriptional regulator